MAGVRFREDDRLAVFVCHAPAFFATHALDRDGLTFLIKDYGLDTVASKDTLPPGPHLRHEPVVTPDLTWNGADIASDKRQ
jgi:hypothetical protein